MGSYILLILGLSIFIAALVYNGVIANAGRKLSNDASMTSVGGQQSREQASQQAKEIAERNQRLMERVKESSDRNKH